MKADNDKIIAYQRERGLTGKQMAKEMKISYPSFRNAKNVKNFSVSAALFLAVEEGLPTYFFLREMSETKGGKSL